MAYLSETSTWETGIYQWETQDPVVGGPDGIDNVPTRQLANRTGYLKAQIAAHAAASDPHPQYTTSAEVATQISSHTAATDPHPQYTTESEVHALTEVTQAAFNNSTKVATTAFVQQALGNLRGISSYTATASMADADWGTLVKCDSATAFTLTFPAVSGVPNGASFVVWNVGSATHTLLPSTGAIIYGKGTGLTTQTSYTLEPGEMCRLTWSGVNFFLEGAPYTPTAPQFDNTPRLATTAFIQRALGSQSGVRTYTASTTLTAADWGRLIVARGTSAISLTLPPTGSVANGSSITFFNAGTADAVLAPATSAPIYYLGASTSGTFSISPGMTATLVWGDGAYYMAASNKYGPTPAQFDDSSRIATTEFVQQALGNLSGVSVIASAATLTAAQLGGLISTAGATADFTLTVPAATVAAGGTYTVLNPGNYTLTLKTTGIAFGGPAGSAALTCAVPAGSGVLLVSTGSAWQVLGLGGTGTTPPQFNNSTRLATTEFVQRALGNFRALQQIGADTTLGVAQAGALVQATASNITLTLPALGSVPSGTTYTFYSNGSSNITIAAAAGEVFGNSHQSTLVLNAQDCLAVAAGGGIWQICGGTANLRDTGVMKGTGWTTPAQFDDATRLATTAFVQRALGNFQDCIGTVSGTLTAARAGCAMQMGGDITLPASGTLTAGAAFLFYNNSATTAYAISVADTTDFIYRPASGWTSTTRQISVPAGGWIQLASRGNAEWNPVAGSMLQLDLVLNGAPSLGTVPAASDSSTRLVCSAWVRTTISNMVNGTLLASLASAAGLSYSLGSTGYLKLPSWLGGLMFQWCAQITPTKQAISFPVAFPTAALAFFATNTSSQGEGVDNAFGSIVSASQYYIATKGGSSVGNYPCAWFAIGY